MGGGEFVTITNQTTPQRNISTTVFSGHILLFMLLVAPNKRDKEDELSLQLRQHTSEPPTARERLYAAYTRGQTQIEILSTTTLYRLIGVECFWPALVQLQMPIVHYIPLRTSLPFLGSRSS
jgi:hypothetical protein